MKQFLFLYPIREYFDIEIDNGSFTHSFKQTCPSEAERFTMRLKEAKSEEQKESIRQEARALMRAKFKPVYAKILNDCIQQRYRAQGFRINFAVFNETGVDPIVRLEEGDNVFEVGVDFVKHNSEKKYPDPDFILGKVGVNREHLRVAGFHMWDCVERVAKRAYEKGIDVLVDEDLTEFLSGRINCNLEFRTDRFPTYNPRNQREVMFRIFIKARQIRPWLWQNY